MSKTYHFSDLKLLPGARIDLRSEQFKQFKGIGLYVGYRQGKNLIVSTPIKGGKPLSCKLGTGVVLRFFPAT